MPTAPAYLLGSEAAELPADEAAGGEEPWGGAALATSRLEVHELPRDERLVGVDDEVVHEVPVLPEVGLHVLREELVEQHGAGVLQLRHPLARREIGILDDALDLGDPVPDELVAAHDRRRLEDPLRLP